MIYETYSVGGVLYHADRANHKYIKKERTKNGKWRYFYTMADYLKDRKSLNKLQRKNQPFYYVFGDLGNNIDANKMYKEKMRNANLNAMSAQRAKDKANKLSWKVENEKEDLKYYWNNNKIAPQELINKYNMDNEDMKDYYNLSKIRKDQSNKEKDRARLAKSEEKIAQREREHFYKQKNELEDLTKKVWKYEREHKIKAKVADKIEKALNKLKKKSRK